MRPTRVEPVKPTAATRASVTAARPSSSDSIMPNIPPGAPAAVSASDTAAATARLSSRWPGLALTTTGQPAARALAVSPPATENAKGKLLAANTSTTPSGTFIRRMSGRAPIGHAGSAWSIRTSR